MNSDPRDPSIVENLRLLSYLRGIEPSLSGPFVVVIEVVEEDEDDDDR